MKHYFIIPVSLIWCGLAGFTDGASTAGSESVFKLTCSSFGYGERIPAKYTADGTDISPLLSWSGVPSGTKSLILICEDPDAPAGNWVHWVIYGIPPEQTGLSERFPPSKERTDGIKQGMNDFRKIGYNGPAPPRGKPHRYFFRLYALNSTVEAGGGLTKEELMRTLKPHILAEAEWMGVYQR